MGSGCKGYIVCQNGSLTSEHDCGEGKLFDANLRACNLEQFVTCESSPTEAPVTAPPTSAPVTPTLPPVSPTVAPVTIVCPNEYTGLIPSNDCTEFYQCLNGSLVSEVPIYCQGLLYSTDEVCMCNFVL